TLLGALETDLDYVHMHTRLLQRAREWDNNKRNPSFTLRGTDLQVAEEWLTEGAAKKPSPTPLHSQYIAVSRQLAVAAQRRLLSIAVFGLVVAVVLAILAATASYQARVAEAEAESNYARSEALRIASDADGLALAGESNAELASLLAIRSLNATYSP